MLRAADVGFGYARGAAVLRGVSMSVPDDEVVGVIGPNGSGKTTLLRVLSGTRRPTRGSVTLDGVSLAALPRAEVARRMAVVSQETHPAFDYSALELVLMGRYPHLAAFEVEGPDDYAAARQALAATGTAAFEDRLFATLSGGEKQRVVLAAALAQLGAERPGASPPLLLLDEPTTALDLGYQLETASLIRSLRAARRLSVVLSTHDLNFAASLCSRLVLLKDGQVLAAGPTAAVLTAANIRALYGVDADVQAHAAAGHLVVVPLRRSGDAPRS